MAILHSRHTFLSVLNPGHNLRQSSSCLRRNILQAFEPNFSKGATSALVVCNAESPFGVADLKQSERSSFVSRCDGLALNHGRVIMNAVDRIDSDEELLDNQDRIIGALQIGVIGCRRSASWICFGGGKRPRRKRAWKTTNRKGSFAKARKLVDLIDETPPAKEDIYGALDAFVAWELEFPIIAIKKAMAFMAEEQKWRQIIQVSKWMLSKGQGKTMGTFTLLLEALDHEGRVEEADALFEKLLTEHEDATPRYMFTVVIAMFERHNNPRRLLQVFADMEELEIKPDMVTVERVARTYRSIGLMKRAEAVEAKYPPTKWGFRYKRGKAYRVRVTADDKVIKSDGSGKSDDSGKTESGAEEGEESDVDSDSDDEGFTYEDEDFTRETILSDRKSVV